jgi:PhnB protein
MAKPIPDGYHSITPHLVIKGASEAIEFYKRAFGARELARMNFPGPDGKMTVGHAEMQIGDSKFFLVDEAPGHGMLGPSGGSPVTIHLYVPDVDATFAQAVAAGATVGGPPADMFWGDRFGKVVDPFGHHWSIATHKEEPTPDQINDRMAAALAGPPCDSK